MIVENELKIDIFKYILWIFLSIASLQSISAQKSSLLFNHSLYAPAPIVRSLKTAYPDKISQVSFEEGRWTLTIEGETFLWADGRLLPADLTIQEIKREELYGVYPFYPYSSQYNPPLPEFNNSQVKELNDLLEQQEKNPVSRHSGFLKALYRIKDEESAWQIMKTIYFLGFKIMIHRDLLEDLSRVEEKLMSIREYDSELQDYIDSIGVLAGFNWRTIEGTETLSNHSFGIAIDIIPKDYMGKEAYWRWTMNHDPLWYGLPWNKRHRPPESFVRAFEEEGFIWGGKWLFYDTIHFEYRPEILILSGYNE